MTNTVPAAALADVTFTEASPTQQTLAWELNGVSWARPMPIPDYIRRERHLSEQELTRDGGTRYWILHPKGKPDEFIAGCECTRKTIFVRRPGENVQEARGYAIASVFTNPAYRKQGMASHMLRCLQAEMDKDGEASVLYSDIGRIYYAQLGWPAFPSQQATLLLLREGPFASPAATCPLKIDDLPGLCDRDVQDLKARLAAVPASKKTMLAFAPTYAQVAWQLAREEFMTQLIHGRSVEIRGAATADGAAWIIWDHDWREQKLKVLRIATPRPISDDDRAAAVTALLQAAIEEASAWGLRKVLVWNPDETVTLGVKGVGNAHEDVVKVVFDERLDGSIPSLRWKDARSITTDWVANEYYAWC